jgi:sensor domain CHASE-containing protein
MNIFEDDLFKNKYFLFVIGIIIVIILFIYLKDYNSLENQCRRRIEKAGTFFSQGNKLQENILNAAMKQEIDLCIKNGNK